MIKIAAPTPPPGKASTITPAPGTTPRVGTSVSGGTTAVKGRPTENERTAVAHMQNRMMTLSNILDMQDQKFQPYVTKIKATWSDNAGQARDDGKFGINTSNALKAIVDLITKNQTTFPKAKVPAFQYPKSDRYSSDTPENVIAAAKNNSDELYNLIRSIGGNAAMLSSGELFDKVPGFWDDENAENLTAGTNAVFAGTIQSLTNFYIFLQKIRVGNHSRSAQTSIPTASKPTTTSGNQLDTRYDLEEPTKQGLPSSKEVQDAALKKEREEQAAYEAAQKTSSTDLSLIANAILDSCIIRVANTPFDGTDDGIVNPWASSSAPAKPAVARKPSIYKITVAEFNEALNWISKRSQAMLGLATSVDENVKNPATGRAFVESDVVKAEKYAASTNNLIQAWNSILPDDVEEGDIFSPQSLKSGSLVVVNRPVDGGEGVDGGIDGSYSRGGGIKRRPRIDRNRGSGRDGSGGSENYATGVGLLMENYPIKETIDLQVLARYGVDISSLSSLTDTRMININDTYDAQSAKDLWTINSRFGQYKTLNIFCKLLVNALTKAFNNWNQRAGEKSQSGRTTLTPSQYRNLYTQQSGDLRVWVANLNRLAANAANRSRDELLR